MRIQSPANPRVKALAALKERKERERAGLFLVEGRREVERALRAGLQLETLLLGPKATPEDQALVGSAPILELSQEAMERVSVRENPPPVIGVFRLPHKTLKEVRLPQNPLVLVLLGLEKPGNLGAILRSADGAGVDLVLVAEGVDLYSPQVIRNSTGVVFSLPVYPASEGEAARFLEQRGLLLVAATPKGERIYWEEDYRRGVAFLLGAEDEGLPEAWLRRAQTRVRIPMRGVADSLNVSVSAALLLYEAQRQRSLHLRTPFAAFPPTSP